MVELATTFSGRAARQSQHINYKPAHNVYHAVQIAEVLGYPLSTLVTINFARTDCPPGQESARWSRLRRLFFTPWISRPPRKLRRERDPNAYVWTLENHGGCVHLHWLVHVPPDRMSDFKTRLRGWMRRVEIAVECPNAVQIKLARNPHGFSYYMLKGTNPLYAAVLGVRAEPQGIIHGPRSGFSRNLGPTVKAELRRTGKYRQNQQRVWVHPKTSESGTPP